MKSLKDHDDSIVVEGDKNLGPCILERSRYILKGFKEHLGNARNYKQLSAHPVSGRQVGLRYLL